MSLLVWLPLNGNLENKGLNLNSSITNNGATVNNAGKIGKCYSFTNQTIVITPSATLKNSFSTQGTLALWVKVSTSHNAYAQAVTFGTVGTSWNNILFGIDINSNGVPVGNISNGSSYTNCSFDIAIKDNQWHHLAFTYDNGTSKVYLDGVLNRIATSAVVPAWTSCTTLAIGGQGSEVFKNGDCINDLRLYNHCLTPEEVEELARGLVLHYPLTERGFEMTKNLSLNVVTSYWNNSGTASWNWDDTSYPGHPCAESRVFSATLTAAGNSGMKFGSTPNTVDIAGKTISASVWFYNSNPGNYSNTWAPYIRSSKHDNTVFNLSYKGNSTFSSWPTDQWIQLTGTGTTLADETFVWFCMYTGPKDLKVAFCGWQIEINDHPTPWVPNLSLRGAQYDRTIYQEPDGSLWVRMFHHNNPAGGLFASSDTFTTGVYKDANKWFDIYGVVNQLSRYEFMVKLKTTSNATEVKYRWIQYANPITAQWEEVTAAKVTRITTSSYTDGGCGGLYAGANSGNGGSTHMIIANSSKSNWYGAAGSWSAYQGGIPGYYASAITSGYFDIYARVDDLEFVKIYDISGYNNHSLVIGNLLSSTDSVRYDRSIKKSNGSYIKSLYRPNDFLPHDQITVNIWVKYSTWNNPVSCTEGGGFNFEANSTYIRFVLYVNGDYANAIAVNSSNINSLKNNWHMLTGVFDGTNIIIYIDGVESGRNSVQRSGIIGYANNWLFLGAEASGASVTPAYSSYDGNLSDFRVYATALSAAAIKDLYNMGVK